ncbi:Zn-ribbon domain-containing OB-fold protein [Streptacidiphilus sp. PB12-B1b]|uniref:Zn-ribbon domain-containing OB-fold protein n=1 Tax=Streptacidiphilus sp. PB12-B1b TaxID=2705012 RepID=UPI003519E1E0
MNADKPASEPSVTEAVHAAGGMVGGMLLPWPDVDGEPFWRYALQGELRVQSCADCGLRRFPPRPCCPGCHSFDSRWQLTSGRGRIWSFVVAHPPLLPAYAEHAPYPVAVVELDDAPAIRLVGALTPSARRPDAPLDAVTAEAGARLRIGAPVQAVFQTVAPGVAVPRWALTGS